MNAKKHVLVCAIFVGCFCLSGLRAIGAETIEMAQVDDENSQVQLQVRQADDRMGLAVVFTGTEDLHYYARSETAPAPEFDLRVRPSAEGVTFGDPVFPDWKQFYDLAQEKNVEVYVGDFEIFLPLLSEPSEPLALELQITGMACTSQLCLPPCTPCWRSWRGFRSTSCPASCRSSR